jgi:hypothetical protein
MAVQLQVRRGPQADWELHDPVLAEGEIGAETDTHRWKLGNGVQDWTDLPYSTGEPGPQGFQGVEGLGMWSTTGQLQATNTNGVNIINTTDRDTQVGDLVVSTNDNSLGRLGRITALTGVNVATVSTVGEVRGPQGYQGNQGHQGHQAGFGTPTASGLAAGVQPTITASGPDDAKVFAFGIPQGYQGVPAGVGTPTVTTLAAGSAATVSISGPATATVFAFGVPQGPQGFQGGPVPTGGAVGDALVKTGAGDHVMGWQANRFVPTGGNAYQVVRKNAANTAVEWGQGIPAGGAQWASLTKNQPGDFTGVTWDMRVRAIRTSYPSGNSVTNAAVLTAFRNLGTLIAGDGPTGGGTAQMCPCSIGMNFGITDSNNIRWMCAFTACGATATATVLTLHGTGIMFNRTNQSAVGNIGGTTPGGIELFSRMLITYTATGTTQFSPIMWNGSMGTITIPDNASLAGAFRINGWVSRQLALVP